MLFGNKCGTSVACHKKVWRDLLEFNLVFVAELPDGGRTEEVVCTGRHHDIVLYLDPFSLADQHPVRDVLQYLCTHRSAGRAGHHGVGDVVCAVGVLAQLAEQRAGHERTHCPGVVEYAVRRAEGGLLRRCLVVPVAAYGCLRWLLAGDE